MQNVWVSFLKTNIGECKAIYFRNPTGERRASEPKEIIRSTVPEQLREPQDELVENAREPAKKTWNEIWLLTSQETQKARNAERHTPDEQEQTSEMELDSENEDVHAYSNVSWDDEAVEKAWYDFRKPCPKFVNTRMAQAFQERFATTTVPPVEVLDAMRLFGKFNPSTDHDYVFLCAQWKEWLAEHKIAEKPKRSPATLADGIALMQYALQWSRRAAELRAKEEAEQEKESTS